MCKKPIQYTDKNYYTGYTRKNSYCLIEDQLNEKKHVIDGLGYQGKEFNLVVLWNRSKRR